MRTGTKLANSIKREFLVCKELIAEYETLHEENTLHDIRVAIRKIRAIIRLADEYYEIKAQKYCKKRLKEVFDKSSEVRDIDTFLLFLEDKKEKNLITKLGEKRELLLHELKATLHTIKHDKELKHSLKKLRSDLEDSRKDGVVKFLEDDYNAIFFEFSDVIEDKNLDFEHLHEMRKRCKKTRYSLESVSKTTFKEKITLCKEFQERLGRINDLNVWTWQLDGFEGEHEKLREAIKKIQLDELMSFREFIQKL